jgi:hypothetical protein
VQPEHYLKCAANLKFKVGCQFRHLAPVLGPHSLEHRQQQKLVQGSEKNHHHRQATKRSWKGRSARKEKYVFGVSSPMSVLPDLMVFSVQIVQYNYKNVTRT